MKDLFTIGETAALFKINIRTLRYYDKIGLLTPEKVDLTPDTDTIPQSSLKDLILYFILRPLKCPLIKSHSFLSAKKYQLWRTS